MNFAGISGRFVKDPELHITKDGKHWVRFRVAVPAPLARDRTAEFIPCVAWDGLADFICNNFCKGKKIEIQGTLRINNVEDDNMEINVEKAFYGEKRDKSEEG